MEWQARRATGAWFDVILKSFSAIHDPKSLASFGITTNISDGLPSEDELQEEWLLLEKNASLISGRC